MSFTRRHPRVTDTQDLSARLRPTGRSDVVGRVVRVVLNLSEGGMLVASSDLDVGEITDFELEGPDFRSAGLATVAHRTNVAVGLRFLRWQDPAHRSLRALIAARTRNRQSDSSASAIPGCYLG